MNVLPGGPAAYLPTGSSWMDRSVVFDIPTEPALTAACQQVWEISAQLRAARGRSGKGASQLGAVAWVRRQTIAAIELGTVWPDARTLAQLCFALGLQLAASEVQVDQ